MVYPLLTFVGKRLVNSGILVLSTALGLLITVTLITAIPLYSEGVSETLLKRELAKPDLKRIQARSSVLLRHFDRNAAGELPTSRAQYEEADKFYGHYLPELITLPELQQVSYLQTDVLPLLSFEQETRRGLLRRDLSYGTFFHMTGMLDNIDVGIHPIRISLQAIMTGLVLMGIGDQQIIERWVTFDAVSRGGYNLCLKSR